MADDASYMSASQSQLLSSSTSSLSPSKLCSKTYKKASNLFLTLRLQEALSALEPAITVVRGADEPFVNGDDSVAPVASAGPTWRIKVWNLYITLLSQIIELGPEEGKKLFGQKEWKAISTTVRDGEIWETVVRTGYRGLEGSVDAEVVHNLATLLLKHSPSQKLNQQRLETYLSSYGQPNLDISDHLTSGSSTPRANGGTDTPKDLAARVKIIELFTLHVLPANEEWEYAQEFINLSEVLDEDRKELFLQTLEGLKEEKQQGELRAAALQREKDAELERQAREEERRRVEEAEAAERAQKGHGRSGSEVDYGIEKTYPNGSIKGKGRFAEKQSSKPGTSAGRTAFSPPGSKNIKKTEKPEARAKQSRAMINVVRNILKYVSKSIAGNPLSFARTLLFMLGIIAALSRQDVRERIRRITGSGWQKLKGTVGMGVKVSYI
ncbi:peroxisome proliferation protein peroxin 26 [Aspergillus eucalypticola CBS 122712]|uniref:Peroxisome proliferation protein peroxin 26 n=1 Tax=Aspergillus eucalypticola (strain CBS 122712 / IBT 29274) TaxID=1448314 RepID=A0A317VBT6_ASPEC|nr:peroxisome proliferation protein peroxin 26 [Aspergillus eucalypticola CBS 122712]PWY70701.1 peroxisome proliferation protein peroxin 26 [Aspergillus eucalypticola CBS 122712]